MVDTRGCLPCRLTDLCNLLIIERQTIHDAVFPPIFGNVMAAR